MNKIIISLKWGYSGTVSLYVYMFFKLTNVSKKVIDMNIFFI